VFSIREEGPFRPSPDPSHLLPPEEGSRRKRSAGTERLPPFSRIFSSFFVVLGQTSKAFVIALLLSSHPTEKVEVSGAVTILCRESPHALSVNAKDGKASPQANCLKESRKGGRSKEEERVCRKREK
jgi:hypothetical protein